MIRPLWSALLLAAAAGASADEGPRIGPSGMSVPRWVSLKFNDVRAHGGPGDDYPVVWTYHARGLPVQIVVETREWRKICDPTGASAWVRRSAVDGRRTLYRAADGDVPLRRDPKPDSPTAATLRAKSIVDLDRIEGDWRRVKVDGATGWVQAADFWGANEAPQCK